MSLDTSEPPSLAKGPVFTKYDDFILSEYNSLRNEMIKHMDIEYQLTIGSITAFGVFAALGVSRDFASQGPLIVFLYPILALLLTLRWRYADHRTREIGRYIRDHIENVVGMGDAGREHYQAQSRKASQDSGLYRWSVRGMFIVTELLAVLLGILLAVNRLPMPIADLIVNVFLFLLALASLLITNMVFVQVLYGTLDGRWFNAFLWRVGMKYLPSVFKELERCSEC